MRNANRDYFITLNAKNSTVTAGNLSFYITDKNTSNIFCQLIFNESNNQLINSYAPTENAEDYIITLRIVKPNNEPKEIRFSILSAPNFVYYVDLTDDYKDIIGTYECECFIDSMINGRLERNTTNSFTYTVKESIMSELDGLLEDLPSYPLVDTLATKEYVDAAVAAGVGGGGASYDDSELRTLIAGKADTDHTHTEYLTAVPDEYITETELTAKNYATKSQIPTSLPANGGNANTVDNIHIWTGTQTQFDAITTKDTSTVYIVKEG